jgi:DnaJ-class molecular chaperone
MPTLKREDSFQMRTNYTDGTGTYKVDDHVVYNNEIARVVDIVTMGGEPRIEIETAHGSTVLTTPALDSRWGGKARTCRACEGEGTVSADSSTAKHERVSRDSRTCPYCKGKGAFRS